MDVEDAQKLQTAQSASHLPGPPWFASAGGHVVRAWEGRTILAIISIVKTN